MALDINQMLISAALKGHTGDVKKALEDGADIHANDDGALQWASYYGHDEIVELLLDRGADIHAKNDDALRMAAKMGHKKTVELLLERGADIHAQNDEAIFQSASRDHKETVLLLLRHGAVTNVKKTNGQDLSEDTNLPEWIDQIKQAVSEHFISLKPSYEQCFITDGKGAARLHDMVIDACVTDQFVSLIGAPLITSTDKADRKLFQDIWDALPQHWQYQHQNLYMQFAKEGGLNPIVGSHTAVTQRDDKLVGR